MITSPPAATAYGGGNGLTQLVLGVPVIEHEADEVRDRNPLHGLPAPFPVAPGQANRDRSW
jgi:hypothetical protein